MVLGLEKLFNDSSPRRKTTEVVRSAAENKEKIVLIQELLKQFDVNSYLVTMGADIDPETGESIATQLENTKQELLKLGLTDDDLYKTGSEIEQILLKKLEHPE